MMLNRNGAFPVGARSAHAPAGATSSHEWSASLFRSFAGALLFFLAFACSVPSMLHAQVQNGAITGTVTDPNNAVVQQADVTLTQKATNLVLHGQTNNEGVYAFPLLLPGPYTVAVEKPGFRKTVATLTLTVGQTVRLDVTLRVGSETQTVVIEAQDATALDLQTSNLDYTVQSQQVGSLPMNGRNLYGLAALAPGIMPGSNFGVGVVVQRGAVVAAATNNFESNGGVGGNNEVLLDGLSIVVCCQGQPAVTPSAEVVGQFKVVTSNAPAEYGRTSGGVLSLVTNSGTNQLRGSIYDFLRNDKLDAANYFTKRSGVYPYPGHADFRNPHRANQYGAFVSGPVFLPHIYNGKDRTFFAFGYEGIRNLSPSSGTDTVPTALMRQGIFTEAPLAIYDPNSSNAGGTARTPIAAATCNGTAYAAGYCVPQSSWNAVAKAMLTFFPAPNLPGTTNNLAYAQNATTADDQYNFRIDHNLSDNQRIFMRGTKSKNNYTYNDEFNSATGPAAWQQHLTAYLFALGDIWTLSPSTLVQFSYGFARQTNFQPGNNFFQYDAAKYGFSSTFTGQQQVTGLPYFSISGEYAPTYQASFNDWAHYVHSFNASALIHKGKHDLALGYNGRLGLENVKGLSGPTGYLTYGSTFTGGPTPNSSLPGGQSAFASWASFLLGDPTAGYVIRQKTLALNQWVNSLYAQDDWRMFPKLTVNMGVRWDVETGYQERHNNWADFDPTVTNPISSQVNFQVSGGANFLGSNGNPTRDWQTLYHAVGPRFGFSYEFAPRTVARGGYGILYLPLSSRQYSNQTSNIGFTQRTNLATSATGFTPAVTSDNPFPSGVLLPAGPTAGVGVSVGTSISGLPSKIPLSYQQQWNFGLERSLGRGMSASLNYVGSHGVDLPMNLRANDLQPAYWGTPGQTSQVTYLQAQVANPFYGATGVASGTLTNATVQRLQLLTKYPEYTSGASSSIQNSSVTIQPIAFGSATYNAMQAMWLVNRPSGLTGSVSYIYSKLLGNVTDLINGSLNPTGNPNIQNYYFMQNEHSHLSTDIPQRIAGTASYPLPIGKGRQYANSLPTWANEFVGGWTVTTIIDAYSGFPLGLTVTGAPAFAGTRPVFTGSAPLTSGSVHHRLGGAGQTQNYFNTAGFRLPQSFELGTVPRSSSTMRSPISFDENASLIKNFPIHEDVMLEFRCEAFNVLNKVDFNQPNVQFGGSSFGNITAMYNSPRNIQLAAKLHF